MSPLRHLLLGLARQRWIHDLVMRYGLTRGFALRFVAGTERADALAVAARLNQRGFLVALNELGEDVHRPDQAEETGNVYVDLLREIHERNLQAYVSVKPSHAGLRIDFRLARKVIGRIVASAASYGNFVRMDMEDSSLVDPTLALYRELWSEGYGQHVGVVVQAYLYRSKDDLEELLQMGARVRLCKGAYAEPASVAYQRKIDTDRAFVELLERLMQRGNYPAIATHDARMISAAKELAEIYGRDRSTYEFQMLYGIRRDLQEQLLSQGYRLRVYVPYGQNWYPYLMRRLAERPANLAFFLRSLLRG